MLGNPLLSPLSFSLYMPHPLNLTQTKPQLNTVSVKLRFKPAMEFLTKLNWRQACGHAQTSACSSRKRSRRRIPVCGRGSWRAVAGRSSQACRRSVRSGRSWGTWQTRLWGDKEEELWREITEGGKVIWTEWSLGLKPSPHSSKK